MSSDNKHINYTAADIEKYLAGNMSAREMHAMEKAALDDPFLTEAMEGYEAMKNTEWNNELVALRSQIAEKGAVAKVIPLHQTKTNRWKTVAAVLILGAGATLTYMLTQNSFKEETKPQIAQTIAAIPDSLLQTNNKASESKTASLNPTASLSKEEIKTAGGNITQTDLAANTNNKPFIPAGEAQIKTIEPVSSSAATSEDKLTALAPPAGPPANSNTSGAATNNPQRAEESIASVSKSAAKTTDDAELLARQKVQANTTAKKDKVLNNYFTAQVVATDNSPLPFTNISIKKDNFGTYADAKGMVRLVSTDSILIVEVKSVGYLPKTFALRNNQAQTKIILQEDEVALGETVIIRNGSTANNAKSRRATLVTDSVVNVEPADGWENYNTYVANNLDLPSSIAKNDFHGEVELSFDVKSNGTISNIRINKSLGAEYDEAAKRLIMEGPQWKVKKGKANSASVKVKF